jgi:hypothetical protein
MSQRSSGYVRRPDEDFPTPPWPVRALLAHLEPRPQLAWDPANGDAGKLVITLRACGIHAIGTNSDFLACAAPPVGVDILITNPPYGERKRGELAVAFIAHALELNVPRIALLLRNDFDSAITRRHLFADEPRFAGKLILLNRIKWFDGPSSPSDNHAWFLWARTRWYSSSPTVRYVARTEVEP